MRENPKELQVYRHFKGNLYQIITTAVHSETGEELVIYRPLYAGANNYARPLSMFMSEVDHEKYPEVTQKYRFELLEAVSEASFAASPEAKHGVPEGKSFESAVSAGPAISAETVKSSEDVETQAALEEELDPDAPLNLDPKLEKFLDAGSYQEKLECFYGMKKTATKDILSYVAMSLDIELSKETVEEQYAEILYCLRTMEKYECNRLRP